MAIPRRSRLFCLSLRSIIISIVSFWRGMLRSTGSTLTGVTGGEAVRKGAAGGFETDVLRERPAGRVFAACAAAASVWLDMTRREGCSVSRNSFIWTARFERSSRVMPKVCSRTETGEVGLCCGGSAIVGCREQRGEDAQDGRGDDEGGGVEEGGRSEGRVVHVDGVDAGRTFLKPTMCAVCQGGCAEECRVPRGCRGPEHSGAPGGRFDNE